MPTTPDIKVKLLSRYQIHEGELPNGKWHADAALVFDKDDNLTKVLVDSKPEAQAWEDSPEAMAAHILEIAAKLVFNLEEFPEFNLNLAAAVQYFQARNVAIEVVDTEVVPNQIEIGDQIEPDYEPVTAALIALAQQ